MDPNDTTPTPADTNASAAKANLRADTDQLARDLDDLLSQLPNLTGEAIDTAKKTFLAKAERGADKLQSIKKSVCNTMENGTETVTEYVHQQPLRALGMAMGIGVLLGALLCRPGHSRD